MARTTLFTAQYEQGYAEALQRVAQEEDLRHNLAVYVIAVAGEPFVPNIEVTPHEMQHNQTYRDLRDEGKERAHGYEPRFRDHGLDPQNVAVGHVACLIIHDETVSMHDVPNTIRRGVHERTQAHLQEASKRKALKRKGSAA